jgi:hypothetical protein
VRIELVAGGVVWYAAEVALAKEVKR